MFPPNSTYVFINKDHPNIVRLEEVYESHSEIYLVQEVCKGGELFDRLDEQPDYHVSKPSYRGMYYVDCICLTLVSPRGILNL